MEQRQKVTKKVTDVVRRWQNGEITCEEMIEILAGMRMEIKRAKCELCGRE